MLKVINVVGARPNFMKVAPIVEAMKRREREFTPLVVHTGQHYDAAMSDAFFRDLGATRGPRLELIDAGSKALSSDGGDRITWISSDPSVARISRPTAARQCSPAQPRKSSLTTCRPGPGCFRSRGGRSPMRR